MKRINVIFEEDALDTLSELFPGKTISNSMRQALSVLIFIKREKNKGNKIFIGKNGEMREVEILI